MTQFNKPPNTIYVIRKGDDLGVELVIDEALRLERKKQLVTLIDEALVNRNEDDFNQYTTELKHLEAFLNE